MRITRVLRVLGASHIWRFGAFATLVLASVTAFTPSASQSAPAVAPSLNLRADPTATVARAPAASPDGGQKQIARRHPLADVAAIVEADVTAINTTYDAKFGPRTAVTFENAIAHAGAIPQTFQLAQLGGPIGDAGYVAVSDLPQFAVGSRYIVFLSNVPWKYTPVWARLAFSIQNVGGKGVIVGPDGYAVTHFGTDGVTFGATPLLTFSNDARNPNAAPTLAANAQSAPDVSTAMAHDAFVQSAVNATVAIGGPLGASVPLTPDTTYPWNVSPTTPQ